MTARRAREAARRAGVTPAWRPGFQAPGRVAVRVARIAAAPIFRSVATSFHPTEARSRGLLWRAVEADGLEHAVLRWEEGGLTVDGLLIGSESGKPFSLRYHCGVGADGAVRSARVEATGVGGALALSADGRGHWFDASGAPRHDLTGCIDVDLSASAFTNALPIRRLELREGEAKDILVVYLTPTLEAFRVAQRYTCLEQGTRYRYEGYPPGFRATLSVDSDGLVVDYPGLFARVA